MRLNTFVLVPAACLLINCASPRQGKNGADDLQQPPRAANNYLNTQAWQCETSGYVVTTQSRHNDGLWIFMATGTLLLETDAQRHGTRFIKDETAIEIDGMNAYLQIGGRMENCHENRPLSIQEEAKLRGVDFLGIGQEPPWRLEISADLIVLKTGYEQTSTEFAKTPPDIDQAARTTRYTTRNTAGNGMELNIVIKGRECTDSMSGMNYSATVLVELNDKQLKGCGRALH
jgi:uncharacterized membrane protein